jgi:hypothetical protein
VTPAEIAEYDQQYAETSETLDELLINFRSDVSEFGSTEASVALAQGLYAVLCHDPAVVSNLLTVAIARLA